MEQIKDITKPKLPDGFSVRPATLDDIEELAEMFNAVSLEMTGSSDFTANELRNDLKSPGFDIKKDTRVILSPDGKIAAYQDVFATSKVPVYPSVWGRVHPDYQNMGLGTYLFGWGSEHAKHVLDKIPADARAAIRTWNLSTWEPGNQLLENLGLKENRHFFEMKIEMQEAPPKSVWPEGITIRKYNHPDEAEPVYRAVKEAFRDHYGYVEQPFEDAFKRFQHARFKDEGFDPELWFLAMDGDEIAGLSLCRKYGWEDKNAGLVATLGVRRPWRRRGLALALLFHSFHAYWDRDQKDVTLGVDAGSLTGAVDLYNKAGMYVHRQHSVFELELRPGRELSTVEVEE